MRKKGDYLLFVDTNIFLDFYRNRNDAALSLLSKLEATKERLISTYIVEMEFKKNRQKVISDSLDFAKSQDSSLSAPAIFKDAKTVEVIDKYRKEIGKRKKTLIKRLMDVLANPTTKDKVYQTTQRLFTNEEIVMLRDDSEINITVKKLAENRFVMGYPPRKKDSLTIADSINWEWIIHVAIDRNANILIASRDSDYGYIDGKKAYINDWLNAEFKKRVSKKKKIVLSPTLAEALTHMDVSLTKEENEVEEDVQYLSLQRLGANMLSPYFSDNPLLEELVKSKPGQMYSARFFYTMLSAGYTAQQATKVLEKVLETGLAKDIIG